MPQSREPKLTSEEINERIDLLEQTWQPMLKNYRLMIPAEEAKLAFLDWIDVFLAAHEKGVRWRPMGESIIWAAQTIDNLEQLATQRGARMQIMKREMCSINAWQTFLIGYPEAADWFDEDGVPTREGE